VRTSVKKSLLAIAVSSVLVSPVVNATNGYFMHGVSTKEKGMAGAGAAFSQDALASANNPAGMAFVGERFDVGLAVFSPSPRSYTVTGTPVGPNPPPGPNTFINAVPGTEYESDSDFFFIPNIGYNWQIDETTTVGVAIYGNGGMNTDYPAAATPGGAGTFGDGDTGINLEQAFFNVSVANKISDKHAIGASVLLVGQKFSAEGLSNFAGFSVDPANLSSGKDDTAIGFGLKFGYQGEVSDGVRVGASYQSKVKMDEFDKYAGLFANGGNFDIPVTYTLGIAIEVGSSGMIVADIQEIKYSGVATVSNPISNLFLFCNPGDASGCLGGTNGAGFGWEDMTVYKIGYQVDVGSNTFRVGYSHADQPIPESEVFFNVLAPAVIEDHITLGWTMRVGDNQEFNIAGMFAPSNSVKGNNPLDGGSTQIEIEMSQWEVQAGWAWRY
jgi:long-chain fatty acid transport protein